MRAHLSIEHAKFGAGYVCDFSEAYYTCVPVWSLFQPSPKSAMHYFGVLTSGVPTVGWGLFYPVGVLRRENPGLGHWCSSLVPVSRAGLSCWSLVLVSRAVLRFS
ncbi:hypothetical protein GE09DRAFT_160540 [Coniochaeta sp. 2T2.1]|nr:hypothetical protein GE09DRAFT_160540 [Coniochaeta sp. 2T2.1]